MYDAHAPRRAFFFLQKQSVATMFFLFESIIIMFSIIRKMFNDYNNIWHHSSIVLLQLRWLSFSWQPINHAFKKFCTTLNENLEILIYVEQKCIKSNTFFCVWVRLRSTRAKKLRVSDSNKFKFQNSKLNNFVCVCVCFPLENVAFLSSHLFQKNKSSIIGNRFPIK